MTERRPPRRPDGRGGDSGGQGRKPRRTPPPRQSSRGGTGSGQGARPKPRSSGQPSGQSNGRANGQPRARSGGTARSATGGGRRTPAGRSAAAGRSRSAGTPRRTADRPRRAPQQKRRPRKVRPPRRLRLGRYNRRLQVSFVLVAFLMSIFAGRLLQLQAVDAAAYADKASNERLHNVTLQASRGDVTDTAGVPLATTVDAVAVTADPKMTRKNAAKIAAVLAPMLKKDRAELVEKLSKPKSRFQYLARKVLPDVWKKANETLQGRGLTGVFKEPDPLRTYPSTSVAASTLGFVGSDGKGLAGLEYALDGQLAGKDGKATYEIGPGGQQIPLATSAEQEPKPGQDIRLTLDRDVQWYAQQRIAEEVQKRQAESGDIVVMDTRTQQIVAMATAPTYDANDATKTTAEERRNRPVQDSFEPGSVAKSFTAAGLIDAGYVDADTKISVPGSLTRGGRTIGDHWDHGTINLTFAGAIARSSNIGTSLANERMPPEEQQKYLEKFGLGSKPGLGIPGEAKGQFGKQPWGDLTRATTSFGQGMSASSVQMTSGLSTIANGGVRVEPSVVKGTVGESGKLKPAAAGKSTRVVSEAAAKEVGTIMEQVTRKGGFAEKAAIPGYRVAGKTGTAQRVDADCGCYRGYTASFGGFAPADNPRFAVYVAVHNPKGDHTGSGVAAPAFHDTMAFALQKYRVPPTGAKSPKLELEW